jgi:hypothetical protein
MSRRKTTSVAPSRRHLSIDEWAGPAPGYPPAEPKGLCAKLRKGHRVLVCCLRAAEWAPRYLAGLKGRLFAYQIDDDHFEGQVVALVRQLQSLVPEAEKVARDLGGEIARANGSKPFLFHGEPCISCHAATAKAARVTLQKILGAARSAVASDWDGESPEPPYGSPDDLAEENLALVRLAALMRPEFVEVRPSEDLRPLGATLWNEAAAIASARPGATASRGQRRARSDRMLRAHSANDALLQLHNESLEPLVGPFFVHEWARFFGCNRNLMNRRLRSNDLSAQQASPKKWEIPLSKLPQRVREKLARAGHRL